MCGRLNVIDDPLVTDLCGYLGVQLNLGDETVGVSAFNFRRFIRATDTVGIIREVNGKRIFEQATWWLLLEQTETGFKPSKYTSFNTRYDKLNTPRSAGFRAFRQSRCIVPVKGFGETEGKGSNAVYTDFEGTDSAIALGGLCREWIHSQTGERVLSCSVITLPPHHKLKRYHQKSMPMILNQHDDSMQMWLDSSLTDVSVFDALLQPYLPQDLFAQRIDKPSTYVPMEERAVIAADG
ncbi:SOS response-associated peptidase family protein [Alteromonas sp. KUL49]|uniref:SOS response-associated peptidase family protein n=1 Tax=Alteromonas sp. KUL49 TaxID=2480798 RepID=UPI00102ED860|nr:SOS response-associated peptidase family protein [Alteromonas sp. KUL49]TAP36857.1 DUF159 family protein [Alteromonas sp. KUL49]GEA13120.1 hypothetical protein KUL49_34950 [Alteromonas sp. KUL49]